MRAPIHPSIIRTAYPDHFASLDRQKATHERVAKRKAGLAGKPKPITKKLAKTLRAAERRNAIRKARHAKHAAKV